MQWIKTIEDFFKKIYLSLYCKVCVWEGIGDWTKTATYWPPQPLGTLPCVVLVPLGCSTGGLGAQPLGDMFPFQHLLTNWSDLQTQSGSRGALLPGGGFLYHILSLTRLIFNSLGGSRGPLLPGGGFLYHVLSPTGLQSSLGVPMAPSAGCGFPYHVLSPTRLISNSLGVPRAPSAGWWLSLPHVVSNSSDLQLTDFLSPPSYIIVQSPTQSLEWHVWSSSSRNNCHAVHMSLSSGASVYECTMGFLPCPIFQPACLRDFFS